MKSSISLTTSQVRDAVRGFNIKQLESLQELIAALIESKTEKATTETPAKAERPRKPRNSVPFIEVKTIKGHRYQYKRWYEDGKLKSEYIGKAEE